ncbi:MAG: ABC transporter permease [Lachnospiraceae bacterium]|nr:ABC transporter permease [Lachnospiraceae bacterium]
MFFRILKKDLKRKKGVNFIVFLFMIMATLFVASSVNNIFVVLSATDYCMEKGKIPDIYICSYDNGNGKIKEWLEETESVKDFSENKGIFLMGNNIVEFSGKNGEDYDINNTIMLQSNWKQHMLIFDQNGDLPELKPGELAMTKKEMKRNHLKEGDSFSIQFGNYQKTFIISKPIQDPSVGSDYAGLSRYLINDSDFQEIEKNCNQIVLNYGVNTTNNSEFLKNFNKMGFDTMVTIEKSMFEFLYVMQMITAIILIVLGVCLIIISFLVLRFTIVFTLSEEYKEIGVMKAIGIKNLTIKKIYLIKYFMLISVAAIIGCAISIPVSKSSIKLVAGNLMLPNSRESSGINVICAFVVMAVVMLLCLLSTNRVRRISAIQAIRNGTTGERFNRKSVLSLGKMGHTIPVLFLAINDILSEIKKYLVLILTFAMGTILIVLSVNTLESLTSEEMAKNFALDTKADTYISVDTVDGLQEGLLEGKTFIEKILAGLKSDIKEIGYETEISVLVYYSLGYYMEDSDEVIRFMTCQMVGADGSHVELVKGYTPVLENEIAMSEQAMKKLNAKIGDTVCMKVGDKVMDMIITASYANYLQTGESVMLNSQLDIQDVTLSGLFFLQVKLMGVQDKDTALENISKRFPEYKFNNMQQVVSSQLGGTMDTFEAIKIIIILLVCGINIMITILMIKIFVIGEKGQIAMLRALGFSIKQLKQWQVIRIGILLIISSILGIICSTFLNNLLLKPVFAIMGAAHMKIQVNILESYCLYPFLLFVIIALAAYISLGKIKRLKIMEINNIE